MHAKGLHVVTGAFGYLGRYITERLLEQGFEVRTITGHPGRTGRADPFKGRVEAAPFNFDNPERLIKTLEGADTLFNTYWVRFKMGRVSHARAVEHTRTLIRAAKEAGVRKFVHISITNPSLNSPYPYFRGKAAIERDLKASGLKYAILRPTVLFGTEDILINNIAWILRRTPIFGVFGSGKYRIQPAYVQDVAGLAVELGQSEDDVLTDAVGPETFTYEGLVREVAKEVGSRALIIQIPRLVALGAGWAMGALLSDVVITRDEIGALMDGLLVSDEPPACTTRFSEWLKENGSRLGVEYASELERHYR